MQEHLAFAQHCFPEAVRLRRHFHQHPELSGQEHQTLAFIRHQLDAAAIPYTQYENGGICAVIGSGSRAIGIRADIDALPIREKTNLPYASENQGVMHACGHDMHTAILLSLALSLKKEEASLPCMVKCFFQPAEETVGGAKVMVKSGCMANPAVEQVLSLHVDPSLPTGTAAFLPGKMNAAVIEMDITVKGRACHGAHPEMGTDAIVAAAHVISALQTIPSRQTAPTTPVIVTVGEIHGGTGRNIIAGEVSLRGTVRVLDMETAACVKEQIIRTASSAAAAFGAEALVTLTDDYPALINDRTVTLTMADTARALLGEKNVVILDNPSMGADDFAYFTQAAPGCYFNIGTMAPGTAPQSIHNETFTPDENALLTGLSLLHAGIYALTEVHP